MERLLEAQEAPVREMADMIAMNPHYPTASSKFETLATLIAKSYDFYEIEIAPLGYVSDMYLPWLTLTGDDLLNWKLDNFDYQTNILWPAPLRRSYWPPVTADFPTIVYQNNSIFLAGPFFGDGILTDGALISRVSVFLPDDGNWSFPSETANSVCPPELCNAPDGRKFWGFVNCVFPYVFIAQGLQAVKDAGLQYSVNADYVQVDSGYPTFLDASRNFTSSDDYVCTSVAIYGWLSWSLCVSQSGGWAPVWAPALYAGVTVLSVLISVLVFFILRSRKKAVEFLEKQVEWNKELETEKEKLQAMMVRQFELIDCFTTRPTSSSLGNNIEGET